MQNEHAWFCIFRFSILQILPFILVEKETKWWERLRYDMYSSIAYLHNASDELVKLGMISESSSLSFGYLLCWTRLIYEQVLSYLHTIQNLLRYPLQKTLKYKSSFNLPITTCWRLLPVWFRVRLECQLQTELTLLYQSMVMSSIISLKN